ncbi:MAG: hypothetical protein R3316_12285 [Rhodovibrionaceae bacterium]|nr:hypothetical protein [Rhodovibrionaceae bacterium]
MPTIAKSLLRKFFGDRSGVSSVEYALLLALIAGGTMASVIALNEAVSDRFQDTADCIQSQNIQADCN